MLPTGTLAWLDQQDARVRDTIRTNGWAIEYVFHDAEAALGSSDRVPFAYTVGLYGMGHPELLILGIPPETAAGVLNELGERVRGGEQLVPGQLIGFDGRWHRIVPEEVPNPAEIVFGANRYYGFPAPMSVPVLQLSYDDRNQRFPWEPDYVAPDMQPRPGTFRA